MHLSRHAHALASEIMSRDASWGDQLAPEVLLREQMLAGRSRAEMSGAHRLMLAVLEDAIVVCTKGLRGRRGSRLAVREAWAWFASTDRASLFAFERICDLLGFDAEYLRRGLRDLASAAGTSPSDPLGGLVLAPQGGWSIDLGDGVVLRPRNLGGSGPWWM
jgi:hypothetical protein